MAMTQDTPERASHTDAPSEHVQIPGTEALRQAADARWVEISDRVLTRALTAGRRGLTVRAQTSGGPYWLSEHVLVSLLRDAVDGTVPRSALAHVTLELRGRDELGGVVIQLIAQYGTPLLGLADQIRALALACLDGVLGPALAPRVVTTLHVHFVDVVPDDPQLAPRPLLT